MQMELISYPRGMAYEKTAKVMLWSPKAPAKSPDANRGWAAALPCRRPLFSRASLRMTVETETGTPARSERRVGVGMNDILGVGLHGQPIGDLRLIGRLYRGFRAIRRNPLVALRAHEVRAVPGDRDRPADLIVRPTGDVAGRGQPGADIRAQAIDPPVTIPA